MPRTQPPTAAPSGAASLLAAAPVHSMTAAMPSENCLARPVRWRHWLGASVSRRLTLGLIAALLVSTALALALGLVAEQRVLRRQQENAARREAQLFEASLQNAMIKRDLGGMADILKHLGHTPGVAQARLLTPAGEVRFDSHAGGPFGGQRTMPSAAAWAPIEPAPPMSARQLCADTQCRAQLRWRTDNAGDRLQIAYPILNHARCGLCHGAAEQHPVNGLLLIDFEPRAITGLGRGPIALLAVVVLSALALFALIMLLTLRRQVTGPLAGLALAADRLATGDFDTRVQSRAHDELGRVAHAFDRMAERLSDTVASLCRERQFLQHLVDGIPDPVVVIGPDYRIRLANQAYAALLGNELPAIVGQPCHQVSCGLAEPCPSTLVTCPVAEISQRPRAVRSMISLKRRDGSTVGVDIDAAPLALDGAHGEGETLVIEVLRPLDRTLRFSQQQRLSTIGLLANGVAHEIHNPLASIRIALQASLRGLRSGRMAREELTGYLELVDHEIDRCVLTTQRMMQMSQTPTETLHPVSLAAAVDDVLALLREECRVRGIAVSVTGVPPALRVMGDEAELRQVLVNLVHNALHAMPGAMPNESARAGAPGFGMGCEAQSAAIPTGIASICNEADRPNPGCDSRDRLIQHRPVGGRIDISGTATGDGQWFTLSVRDTGCGIAAADLPLIFMPFFSRRADGQRGTGLGLAISKAILERFGGRIDVNSAPGRGSDFWLTLRRAPDAASALTDNEGAAFRAPVNPG
ncbi:MAG: HAMP domain-containing protein [Burkholderiaceae bacterium]|jgi:signal transduction histidine kinase|nr:HAMP domain-containing protein [Burkholderiaceae bacterium]